LIADITRFLDGATRRYDIVSCFSILHHLVLGVMRGSAEEFIAKVDAVTGTALFLDTGESHEDWFEDRQELAAWDARFIRHWLKEHTSFATVEVLGTDGDNVGPYQHRYKRHVFACSRH
jgi:hypothetical protein